MPKPYVGFTSVIEILGRKNMEYMQCKQSQAFILIYTNIHRETHLIEHNSMNIKLFKLFSGRDVRIPSFLLFMVNHSNVRMYQ